MSEELKGKIAIVTGGAKGIGGAVAELFVEEGAQVVIADLDETAGNALAARLGAAAQFRRVNVSNRAEVQGLVDDAIATFGGLHIMVNNAGVSGTFYNRFLDDKLDDLEQVMAVNLAAVMYGSQSAARHMVRQGGGSIINTSSIAALAPSYALFAYRASKAGVITFSKSMAIDLGEYGIRVNCLAPGHIPTALNSFSDPNMSAAQTEAVRKAMAPVMMVNQPLKRQGTPRDVANAAVFLGSDRSIYITGQVIAVDGGVTAGDPINLHGNLMEARAKALGG